MPNIEFNNQTDLCVQFEERKQTIQKQPLQMESFQIQV